MAPLDADARARGPYLLPALANAPPRRGGHHVALDPAALGPASLRSGTDRELLLFRVGSVHRRHAFLGSAAATSGLQPGAAARRGGRPHPARRCLAAAAQDRPD